MGEARAAPLKLRPWGRRQGSLALQAAHPPRTDALMRGFPQADAQRQSLRPGKRQEKDLQKTSVFTFEVQVLFVFYSMLFLYLF